MNPEILNLQVQEYIRENLHQNLATLSLKKSPFEKVSMAEIVQQIKGVQVAKSKFPFLFQSENVVYPPSLNLEQASSWATAQYKASVIQAQSLLDLTSGLGIDSYAFAQKIDQVIGLEQNPDLAKVAIHNFQVLGQSNLEIISTRFEDYFEAHPNQKWDAIYLDPARRKNAQKKFLLEDLEPNVLEWLNEFLKRADEVWIKLSPLMDLKKCIDQLENVTEIHLVALKNEMKDLLLRCTKKKCDHPKVIAVNLESDQADFEFQFSDEKSAEVAFSAVKKYLYEPNVALLKSGAFKLIGQKFNLQKLHANTQLYTSDELNLDFPGRIYEIIEELKDLKKQLTNRSFHIISKNYPLSVEQIRKKYKIKESENQSLIFTTSEIGKQVLTAKRVSE